MDEATKQFIEEHLHDNIHALALMKTPARVDRTLALCQIEARQLLSKKVPAWATHPDLLFPPHLSIEQCSSEATARYKAGLLRGESLVDLTGGLGIDCCYLSSSFQATCYVERNPELCALASHNFEALGRSGAFPHPIIVHCAAAEDFLNACAPVDAFFLDPARRDLHGRKMVSIADCTPDVVALQDLLLQKSRQVLVKLSPMLDITKALTELRHVKEVHVVAVANECKELLCLMESGFQGTPSCTCIDLQTPHTVFCFPFSPLTFHLSPFTSHLSPLTFLYEPNAALMKAGCFGLLEERFQVRQLHPNSHLFTSDHLVEGFPGRVFEVEGWAPFNKRVGQTLLQGVRKASVAVRNFPLSVAQLRQTLKLADGDEVYLFATTLGDNKKVLIRARRIGLNAECGMRNSE